MKRSCGRYTSQDYLEMVMCYRECGEVVSGAVQLYQERFGVRPSNHTIQNAVYRFRETGGFGSIFQVREGGRPRDLDMEDRILEFYEQHPNASSRKCAVAVGSSHSTVLRFLREEGLLVTFPCFSTKKTIEAARDLSDRLEFCHWLCQKQRQILWTDVAIFTQNAMSQQCSRYFENQDAVNTDKQQFCVNVWAGILGDRMLGPVFVSQLNSEAYLSLHKTEVNELLDDVPLELLKGMYFQLNSHEIQPSLCEFLNSNYGDRWIGHGGPVLWPKESQDLNPFDFFFWPKVKRLVYGENEYVFSDESELRKNIESAFSMIKSDTDTLKTIAHQVYQRADMCK